MAKTNLHKIFYITIKTVCEYEKGNESGIFFISYFDKIKNKQLSFFIYRGIPPATCLDLQKKSLKLKKKYKFLTLSGANSPSKETDKEISWFWKSLKGGKECVSYFVHECE